MTKALENDWPVSQLKARIVGKVPFAHDAVSNGPTEPARSTPQGKISQSAGVANQSTPPQSKTPKELAVGLQNYATSITALRDNLDRFATRLDRLIHEAHETDLGGAVLAQLKQARAALDATYRSNSKRLQAWIEHMDKIAKAPTRSQGDWDEKPADGSKDHPADEHAEHADDALAATAQPSEGE